jgi:hypothetical protein
MPADPALALFVHAPTAAPSRGRVRNPLNARWSWPERHRWARQWRQAVIDSVELWWYQAARPEQLAVKALLDQPLQVGLEVRRHGRPLDGDACVAAVKPCRDAIAEVFGTSGDDSETLGHTWQVSEVRGQPPGIAVSIAAAAAPADAAR